MVAYVTAVGAIVACGSSKSSPGIGFTNPDATYNSSTSSSGGNSSGGSTSGAPGDDSGGSATSSGGGGNCSVTCSQDSDCQNMCTGGSNGNVWCCDTMSNSCFMMPNACPAMPDAGTTE
jgi:hypothetical protein